jgi:hypothetical protein
VHTPLAVPDLVPGTSTTRTGAGALLTGHPVLAPAVATVIRDCADRIRVPPADERGRR